jgi:hypothetical protein
VKRSERFVMIRLASALPPGSPERKDVLTSLQASAKGGSSHHLPSGYDWDYDRNSGYWTLSHRGEDVGGVGENNGRYLAYLADDDWPMGRGHSDEDNAKAAVEAALGI